MATARSLQRLLKQPAWDSRFMKCGEKEAVEAMGLVQAV
jgi:hypothetical protein